MRTLLYPIECRSNLYGCQPAGINLATTDLMLDRFCVSRPSRSGRGIFCTTNHARCYRHIVDYKRRLDKIYYNSGKMSQIGGLFRLMYAITGNFQVVGKKTMLQANTFSEYRPLLFSIAYRMLGSVMDAEDMVQEAFLRWQREPSQTINAPKAYLTTIITRLCLDYLKSARAQREVYVGPWLPEPLRTSDMPDMTANVEQTESLSIAFLTLLETLSPVERAVFLLHDVFDYDYAEIAPIVEKNEANCRQLLRRAKQHLEERRPRYSVTPEQRRTLLGRFVQAATTGDMDGLVALLAQDAVLKSDGGGKVTAARKPLHGSETVARFLLGIIRKNTLEYTARLEEINGQPTFVVYMDAQPVMVMALDIAGEQVREVNIMVNPDKLRALQTAS
jgi:RNA polymerase sigma-70 factor, ECF subfamily